MVLPETCLMPEPTGFVSSNRRYEQWLNDQLGTELVKADLVTKREKMGRGACPFLRATYWRWAETVLAACPKLAELNPVLSVGDLHLENFGTWRDAEGRLVWGINDFDETAVMPFALDITRLATSILLAEATSGESFERLCAALLAAYRKGLDEPRPIVLDQHRAELRARMAVPEKDRAKFWNKIAKQRTQKAPDRFQAALLRAMPEPGLVVRTSRRVAGLGSLGRPRWLGQADWKGGAVLREAKAVLPSAWHFAQGSRDAYIRVAESALGRFRAIDPWYSVTDGIVVRRLSPNNRKIEADANGLGKIDALLVEAMGLEVANIHANAGRDAVAAIRSDLRRLPKAWLAAAATTMAEVTRRDLAEWQASA